MNATASAVSQPPGPAAPAPDVRASFTPSTVIHLLACLVLMGLTYVNKLHPVTWSFRHTLPASFFESFLGSLPSLLLVVRTGAIIAVFCFWWPRVRNSFGIIAAIFALGVSFVTAVDLLPFHAAAFRPAFFLDVLAALAVLILSTESVVAKTVAIAARLTSARTAEVTGHWYVVVAKAHFSTFDFYDSLEKNLANRRLPGVEWLRIKSFEAGLLSARREYLRIVRQRHIFDICAAQFGTEYFFSCREGVIPVAVNPTLLTAFVIGLFALFGLLFSLVGLLLGLVGYGLLLVALFGLLRNLNLAGLGRVDAFLLTLPGIGVLYEAWFRQPTYFQYDTRLVFLTVVNTIVKEAVETTTAEKGVQLLQYHEHEPVLAGLYQARQKPLNPPPKRGNHSSSL